MEKFFYSVQLKKKKIKKINFINLFGHEVKKIISKVLQVVKLKKSEENKFL